MIKIKSAGRADAQRGGAVMSLGAVDLVPCWRRDSVQDLKDYVPRAV